MQISDYKNLLNRTIVLECMIEMHVLGKLGGAGCVDDNGYWITDNWLTEN